MVNSYIMYKKGLSTKPSTKNTHFTQTDFPTNVTKTIIAEAINELVPPTAPWNSSSLVRFGVQQRSRRHSP